MSDVHDELVRLVAERAAQIKLGDPNDPATEMCPVANAPQYEKVLGYLRTAHEEGAIVAYGGGADSGLGGLFVRPTVLTGVGNLYRAELLFRHQLDPLQPGCALHAEQWSAMWSELVQLMGEGMRRARIDTVRPEHDPIFAGRASRQDRHGEEVYVYCRAGAPCLVCGTVVTVRHVGRNLYWCPCCQRRPAP